MIASTCPASYTQIRKPRTGYTLPAIPAAYDLASLLRAINLLADAVRALTNNYTINNLYIPRQPFFASQGDTLYATDSYDEVYIVDFGGIVYNHHINDAGERKRDSTQKVYVTRQSQIQFESFDSPRPNFFWSYYKKTDQDLTAPAGGPGSAQTGDEFAPETPQPTGPTGPGDPGEGPPVEGPPGMLLGPVGLT